MHCGKRAERTGEGSEDDMYRCEAGHVFGIDWSMGAPTAPQWPPPEGFLCFDDLVRSGVLDRLGRGRGE
jgi:hypothetical protein